jgi:16S rRNA (guanine527-N7)-methyltransferase
METALIQTFFPHFSAEQLALFSRAYDLFLQWNEKINMVSRKDAGQLQERHVLHSLSILHYFSFEKGTSVLDVGTGGGFPGLPLAIALPDVNFTLLDSIAKKIQVIANIVKECHIPNVKLVRDRVEAHKLQYDFVTGRAVTNLKDFVKAVRPRVHCRNKNEWKNGILYLKGGEQEQDLANLKIPYQLYWLHEHFPLPYFETKQLVYLGLCK